MTEKGKGKGAEVPAEMTEEEQRLVEEAQTQAAIDMGAEPESADGDERCDPEVLAKAQKDLEELPAKIERLKERLRDAGIYVSKFSKRHRTPKLSELVAGLHKSVKADLKQKDVIVDKVTKAVKAAQKVKAA